MLGCAFGCGCMGLWVWVHEGVGVSACVGVYVIVHVGGWVTG